MQVRAADARVESPDNTTEQKHKLEEDFVTLSEIASLTKTLSHCHDNLEASVNELTAHVNKELSMLQLKTPPPEATQLHVTATSQ